MLEVREQTHSPVRSSWPVGGGMAALVRTRNWSRTSLGPLASWPQSLKTAVDVALACHFPMIVLWGPELIQIYNNGYRDLMDLKHPAGLGQPTRECWPEVWHINEPIYARVWAGEAVTLEDQLFPITRHGYLEQAYFTLCYSPVRDESNQVGGVLVTVFETTARLQAERQRRQSEESLRESEAWLVDQREALQAALTGAPLEASLGVLVRTATDRLGPDARAAFYVANSDRTTLHHVVGMPADYAEAVNGFAIGPESLACGLATHSGRPVLTSDVTEEPLWASWLWLAEKFDYRGCWSFPIHTVTGQFVGSFALYSRQPRAATPQDVEFAERVTQTAALIIVRHTDMEVRQRTEEALRESEERFRLFVENVREYALVQTDPEGTITSWNPGAQRLFGYRPEQMLGRNFSTLLTPEDQQAGVLRQELTAVAVGQRCEEARWFVREDGSRFWARWISEPILDETGKFRGVAKIMRDDTERERAEAFTRRSLAEKEELLKEVHHRVKNNLQVITSLLNLQAAQVEDERVLALFEETCNRVQAIAAIHELIYRSTSFAAIDLAAYARQLVPDLVRFYGAQQRIRAEVQGNGVSLELQRAVPFGLLLNELVSNVCKHAFPGGAEGDLTITLAEADGHIVLQVADTGVGLPEGFDLRRTPSLGLQLVYNLTRQLKGTIELYSGRGTTAQVRLLKEIGPDKGG